MKVLLNWLKEYVDFDLSPFELADRLSNAGIPVESVKYLGEKLDQVVVGEIVEITPHPQATHLSLCQVSVGKENLSVVCGAPNIEVGQKVPVALPGAILPNNMRIEEVNIKGALSQGMICSEAELGAGDDTSGILVFPKETAIGTEVKKVLGLDDYLIEFEITPNRPDCLGIIGISREVAALLKRGLKKPLVKLTEIEESISSKVKIEIADPYLCPRYSARLITGVKIAPSPPWMQRRLRFSGIRPINNVVDITNYVMLETGQPLHAFDFEMLAQSTIIVRRAHNGERITTLDGVERELDSTMLVIADAQNPVALAGIMGGSTSEVSPKTQSILLESAHFAPSSILRTSRKLGLLTEASARFEKGVDPSGTIYAVERAAQMIKEISGGNIYRQTLDLYPKPRLPWVVNLRPWRVNQILGTNLTMNEINSILKGLDLDVAEEQGIFKVFIPTFRFDLEREIDLIEEVAREYGYSKIASTLPERGKPGGLSLKQKLKKEIRNFAISSGFWEVFTYSFINPASFDYLKLNPNHPWRKVLKIANPLSQDQSVMRTSLLPGLLEVLQRNVNRGIQNLAFFEIGVVFQPKDDAILPDECEKIALALLGSWRGRVWYRKEEKIDFFDGKGFLEALFNRLGIEGWRLEKINQPFFHPERGAQVVFNSKVLGIIGELYYEVSKEYDLPENPILIELELGEILNLANLSRSFKEIPRYPPVVYDVAVILDESIPSQKVRDVILKAGEKLLEKVEVFDIYQGKKIPKGKKSLAFSLTFRSLERTLTEEEAKEVFHRVIAVLQSELEATIRTA